MTIKVSNSQALALTCEAKWMYAFHPEFRLEPKSQSVALTRGSIGHKALEIFFKGIMMGIKREEAEKGTIAYLVGEITKASAKCDYRSLEAATNLTPLIQSYFKSKVLDDFLKSVEILSVEKTFEVELPGGFSLVGQADLVVKYTRGPYNGEITPVDHKFVYNFWTVEDFKMNSQIPTYIYGLRHTYPNAVIRRGVINQIRYRDNAVVPYEMTAITPEPGEVDNVIANHIKQSLRIEQLRRVPGQELRQTAIRSLSKYTCGNCGFRSLCKAELTNKNTQAVMETEFQPNSYGYDGNDD